MSDEPQDDIRASLASAIAADTAASEPIPETSAVEPVEAEAPAEVSTESPGTSEPARDERGRFAPKQDTAPTDSPTEAPVAPADDQPTVKADTGKPPIAPPRTWSDASKVKWQRLPREVQEELVKVDTAGRYGALNDVIEPNRQQWAMRGHTPEQAISTLVTVQAALERDWQNGSRATLDYLERSYGHDPSRFHPPANGPIEASPAQAGEPEYVDPQVAALRDELSGLKQQLGQFASHSQAQAQAQEEQRRTTIASQVSAFRADPSHPHFDIVEGDIAALLRVNPGLDLQKAYDKAIWANDATRDAILAEQRMAEQSQREAEAKQRVERARAASGSVTGSPSPGASVAVTPNSDLRAMLTEQVMAHARV